MTTDLAIFLGLAAISTLAGISMLLSRNAIYSALFLVLNFLAVATLYLLLNAAFIAMVQITVYAGAIMVLFLFVIMLLGPARDQLGGPFRWQLPVALLLGCWLAVRVGFRHARPQRWPGERSRQPGRRFREPGLGRPPAVQ